MNNIRWGIADQLLSTLSNIFITFWAMYHLDLKNFGIFSLLYASAMFIMGVHRALFCEVLLVNDERKDDDPIINTKTYLSKSVFFSFLVSVLLIITTFFVDPLYDKIIFFLVISFPILLYQDLLRYHFISLKESISAFVLDLIWLISSLIALLVIYYYKIDDLFIIYIFWAVGAFISLTFSIIKYKRLCFPKFSKKTLIPEKIGLQFMADALLVRGGNYIVILALNFTSGAVAVGILSSLIAIISPIGLLFTAWTPIGIVEIKNRLHQMGSSIRHVLIKGNLALLAVTIVWFLFLYLLPDNVTQLIFKEKWVHISPFLPLMFLFMLTLVFRTNATILLKAKREGALNLKLQFIVSTMKTLLSLIGVFFNVYGLLLAWVLSGAISSIIWMNVMKVQSLHSNLKK